MITKFYTLASTRDLNEIRYIGKTVKPLHYRLDGHLCAARRAKNLNYTHNHNYNWINKEVKEGYSIIIEEIDECDSNFNWQLIEKYWISQFKSWGFKLNNISEGGDGVAGYKQSEELIRKRTKPLIGTHRSEETKKKISESSLGKEISQETKNKIKDKIINLQGRKVKQYDLDGNFIKTWDYIKLASTSLHIDAANISACCMYKPNHSTAGGYIWRYEEDNSPIIIDKSNYIVQIDFFGNKIKEWKNANLAGKELDMKGTNILKVCKNEFVQYRGCLFMFLKDYENISKEDLDKKINIASKKAVKKVAQYDLNKNLIKIYNNCAEVERELKIGRNTITKCCKGEKESYKGFIFQYI